MAKKWERGSEGSIFFHRGKNILTEQRWGLMSLGLKETIGNEAKVNVVL